MDRFMSSTETEQRVLLESSTLKSLDRWNAYTAVAMIRFSQGGAAISALEKFAIVPTTRNVLVFTFKHRLEVTDPFYLRTESKDKTEPLLRQNLPVFDRFVASLQSSED